MQAGWAVGWAAATILYAVFFFLPVETAWRVLFMVGIAPAVLVFFVRRYVEEPPVYLESRAILAAKGEKPSFLEIFRPPLLRVTLLGGLMGTGAQGGYNAVMTFLPTFLRTERGLSVLDSTGYLAVFFSAAFCGYLTGGFLSDRIGRRLQFLVFAIGAGIVVVTYTSLSFGNGAMLVLGFPLGFFASASSAPWAPSTPKYSPHEFAALDRASPTISDEPREHYSRRWWDTCRRPCFWAKRSAFSRGSPTPRWPSRLFFCPRRKEKSSPLDVSRAHHRLICP